MEESLGERMRERRVKGRRDWSVFLSEVRIEGRRIDECHVKGKKGVEDNSENKKNRKGK